MTETIVIPLSDFLFVINMLLSSKITSRWVQCFGVLQNMKMKLYSNMKNVEELWAWLLEQINKSIRGKGTSAQLVMRNKWMDVGRAWKRWGVQKL